MKIRNSEKIRLLINSVRPLISVTSRNFDIYVCIARKHHPFSSGTYETSGMQKISVCQYCIYSGMNPKEYRDVDL